MTLHPPDLAALPAGLADHLLGVAAAPQVFGRFPGLDLLPADLPLPRKAVEGLVADLAAGFTMAIENRAAAPALPGVAVPGQGADHVARGARPTESRATGRARAPRSRGEPGQHGHGGVLVPLTGADQSEYVPRWAQRLCWLTRFTGSAGLA